MNQQYTDPSADLLWQVRTFLYRAFAETARPPHIHEVARHFHLSQAEVAHIYQALDRIHAFFLAPGTLEIRIANPFSAQPTPFQVEANGKRYWANCAWDALGIPAALHADAHITAACAGTGQLLHLRIEQGQLLPTSAVVHFVVPFSHWYENMAFT